MEERKDLVSIIVPAYNVEKYIFRCMDSLMKQSYTNIEIIVVDDGSTDATGDICCELCRRDNRIIYVRKENEGQGAARNLGIEIASGEFVTFADSDDWCADTYVEKMLASMKKYDTDICVCGKYGVKLSEKGDIISQVVIEQWMQPEERIEVSTNRNLIYQIKFSLWAKMFRRELFTKYQILQPDHKYENNTVIPMLVSKAKSISMVDEPLYYYWMNREGSTINTLASYFDMIKCLEDVEFFLKKEELWDDYREAFYHFAKWNVIHTLNRVSGIKKDSAEYQKLFGELHDFMSKHFPEKVDWLEKKVMVWGSFNIIKTVRNLVPERNILGKYSYSSIVSAIEKAGDVEIGVHPNVYRNGMIQQDINKTFCKQSDKLQQIDYLFVDLMEERFSVCRVQDVLVTKSDIFEEVFTGGIVQEDYRKLWEEHCQAFIMHLLKYLKAEQIILVKYKLAEQKGTLNRLENFDEVAKIQKVNDWLTNVYSFFENKCEGCRVIEVSEERYMFADRDFEYGCYPYYLNYMMFDMATQKISKQLEVI